VIEDLSTALTKAIEELTRPIDAIKHQAKTVTVGISRSDETLLRVPLVQEVLATGAARDRLTYRALRTLVALDPAVDGLNQPARRGDMGSDQHRRRLMAHPAARRLGELQRSGGGGSPPLALRAHPR